MSKDGVNSPDEDALGRLEALRDTPVPDPGPLYWTAFPGRIQQRLAGDPPARRWVPWAGVAMAATLLLFVWMGGRLSQDPPISSLPGPVADSPMVTLDQWDAVDLDGTLDQVLGEGRPGTLAIDLQDLSPEEKQALLDNLRTELSRTLTPAPGGQGPA